jgi:hypothetical protein
LEDDNDKTAALLGCLEVSSKAAERLRVRDDAALEAAGFEQLEDDLWVKEGVCYGRKAALQKTMTSWPGWY